MPKPVSKYSIILLYQFQPDRKRLFDIVIRRFLSLFINSNNVELCVHETGPKRTLTSMNPKIRYLYSWSDFPFHRAWAFNVAVKKLATGELLVLSDSDVLVDEGWKRELLGKRGPAYAWGSVGKLTEQGTNQFIKTGVVSDKLVGECHSPQAITDAGRIFLISRRIFNEVIGIPEDFKGTWGGEDNAFVFKLNAFGYEIGRFNSKIYHLYHKDTTPRVASIRSKAILMKDWTKDQWCEHMTSGLKPTPKADPVILVRLISWNRPNKLLRLLRNLPKSCKLSLGLCLRIQGAEKVDLKHREEIAKVAKNFVNPDIYYTEGNVGTALAQHDVTERSKKFNIPYLFYTDDDMIFPEGGIELLLSTLEGRPDLAGAELKSSGKFIFKLGDNGTSLVKTPVYPSSEPIPTDLVGSGATLMRAEIVNKTNVDTSYFIGLWDWDLCMQINKLGHSFVTLNHPDFKTINDGGADIGTREDLYSQVRYNNITYAESYRIFKQKWGFVPDHKHEYNVNAS